ncbi:MAG TPA: TonB-dependent receptor [Burkholderiaceae bacterium]|nr:TonB-dependent receptor [Burkholderiaceae bacterium]
MPRVSGLLPALLSTAVAAQAPADLTSLSLEQLMQVPVVGASKYQQRQRDIAAAVSVVTREQIRLHGWRTIDEVLAALPGLHITYDRQYKYLGARGFGLPGDYTTRVLIAINGNRANEVVYDSGPMGRHFPLDLGLVERVEFIAGPGGAIYGQNAMFGVVNVVTRDAASLDGTELQLGGDTLARAAEARVSMGRKLEGGASLLLSASAYRARGQDLFYDFGAAGVVGRVAGADGERDRELFARYERGPWSAEVIAGRGRKDDPTGAYLSDPLSSGNFQGDSYVLTQFQYEDDWKPGLRLSARVFTGIEAYDSRLTYGGAPFLFPTRSHWRGLEARLLVTAYEGHTLLLGTELQDNWHYQQEIVDVQTPANNIRLPGSSWRGGVYVQDEWRLNPALALTLGLRVDRNSYTGTETSPRLALVAQPSEATTLKALFGRAHRAPNAYEREYEDAFIQIGNPTLAGESIDTLELVGERRFGEHTQVRASLYHWTLKDLIVLGIDPASGLTQYQSGGDVKAHGVELAFERAWDGGVVTRGSAAFQNVGRIAGLPAVNSPRRLFKLQAEAPLPWHDWRLGVQLRAESGRRAIDGTWLGGYGMSDLTLRGALGRSADLTLGVTNLLDKRYAHPGSDANWQRAIEQDGRSLRVQWLLRF